MVRECGSVLVWVALCWSVAARAHHSNALFDQRTTVEIRGTVVELRLASPHSTLVLETSTPRDDALGSNIERWEIQCDPVSALLRRHLTPDTFRPGDAVTVVAWPSRRTELKRARALKLVAASGTVFVMAGVEDAAATLWSLNALVVQPNASETAGASPGQGPSRSSAWILAEIKTGPDCRGKQPGPAASGGQKIPTTSRKGPHPCGKSHCLPCQLAAPLSFWKTGCFAPPPLNGFALG